MTRFKNHYIRDHIAQRVILMRPFQEWRAKIAFHQSNRRLPGELEYRRAREAQMLEGMMGCDDGGNTRGSGGSSSSNSGSGSSSSSNSSVAGTKRLLEDGAGPVAKKQRETTSTSA